MESYSIQWHLICSHGIMFIYCIFRWLSVIAVRQNARFFQFSQLTIVRPSVPFSVRYTSLELRCERIYLAESQYGIFQMCLLYLFYLIVIRNFHCQYLHLNITCCYSYRPFTVVPGRMLHIIAVTSRNFLKLKQLFVRFPSHEIRLVHGSAQFGRKMKVLTWIHRRCFCYCTRSPLTVVHAGLDLLLGRSSQCRSCESVCSHPAQHSWFHHAHVRIRRISHLYIELLAAVRAHGSR